MAVAATAAFACGIQPIAINPVTKEVYLLVGREQDYGDGWYDSGKYAGFGGKREKGETPDECAVREGYEETMGILGNKDELRELIKKRCIRMINFDGYFMYIVAIPYDDNLPIIFNNVYEYFNQCLDIKATQKKTDKKKSQKKKRIAIGKCPIGFFEKRDIKWVSLTEMTTILQSNTTTEYRKTFLNAMMKLSWM
jgi:hypothetical protein